MASRFPSVPAVRKATRDDLPRLAAVLARAFLDDPVTVWAFRGERTRLHWAERLFHARLEGLLDQDEIYATTDLSGGALWALPDQWRPRLGEIFRYLPLARGVGRHLLEVIRGFDRMESAHPGPPHYYLAVLGTDPRRQGEGVGSALMGPVLQECDEQEIPAYLESSKERNLDFYARHGFRVTGEIALPNGPPVWLMWRDPR
jgi:ribosomal protein S18 acetylase RimI-like enzyme